MSEQTEAQRILAQWQKCDARITELEAANAELLETLYRLAYIRTNMEFPPVRSIAEEMRIIAQTAFNKHSG